MDSNIPANFRKIMTMSYLLKFQRKSSNPNILYSKSATQIMHSYFMEGWTLFVDIYIKMTMSPLKSVFSWMVIWWYKVNWIKHTNGTWGKRLAIKNSCWNLERELQRWKQLAVVCEMWLSAPGSEYSFEKLCEVVGMLSKDISSIKIQDVANSSYIAHVTSILQPQQWLLAKKGL